MKAGEAILGHYQDCWEVIHNSHERNSRKGSKCDRIISKIKRDTDSSWSQIMTIEKLVSEIPVMNGQVKQAMNMLGTLESLFSDVEVSLLALEDMIDAREMQERELEQRFQLTMHQERQRTRFNQLSEKLQKEYDAKKKKRKVNSLMPPTRRDPDASLETVDLNEEDEVLVDVSPLPKDEDPKEFLEINISPASSGSPTGTLSKGDSIYFTPDTTNERLDDVKLNE